MLLNFLSQNYKIGAKVVMFLKETDHLLVPGGTEAFDPNTTIFFKQCPGLVKLVILLQKYIILLVTKCPMGSCHLIGQ